MIRCLHPEPATRPMTWRIRLADWWAVQVRRTLNRLGVPGAIRDLEYHDQVTGCTIGVRVGLYFTIVTVDGRDFYFDRITGKLDGTGQAV